MKVKGFGAWLSQNVPKGGRRAAGDEYNLSYKKVRYKGPPEYPQQGDEYYHYDEIKDISKKEKLEDKKSNSSSGSGSSKDRSRSTSRMRANFVGRVAAMSVGTIVLVNTNPVLAERLPFLKVENLGLSVFSSSKSDPEEDIIIENWRWSEDYTTATLELTNGKGKLIGEYPATVTEVTVAATCTKEGSKTYTASVETEDEDKTYSDSRSETLPPLGHTWDEGKVVIVEDGKYEVVYECTECHEHFTITASVEEEQ